MCKNLGQVKKKKREKNVLNIVKSLEICHVSVLFVFVLALSKMLTEEQFTVSLLGFLHSTCVFTIQQNFKFQPAFITNL